MKTITLEEHFASPGFMDGPGQQLRAQAQAAQAHPHVAAAFTQLIQQLSDVGDQRIADMDAAGIDMQVLSLTSPGVEQLDAAEAVALASDSNDFLADAVAPSHPVCRPGSAAHGGAGCRRRRAGAHGARARLQGSDD